MAGRFYVFGGAIHYELEWDYSRESTKKNQNGTSGWAKIISRSSGSFDPDAVCRVHLCSFDPCRAVYRDPKYGPKGPPIHVRPSSWRPPGTPGEPAAPAPAVPEPPVSAVAEPPVKALAEPVVPLAPVVHLHFAPWNEAPPALPVAAPAAAPLEPPAEAPPAEPAAPGDPALPALPVAPTGAALPARCAAPPLPGKPQAAVAASAPPHAALEGMALPQLAEATVLGTLLNLAREIRRPRAYIGYSAFVCFALARECRPYVWEGDERIDLVDVHVPWAKERCARSCVVDAVCCCVLGPAVAGGSASLMQVCEEHPLSECSHFVAACPLGGYAEGGASFHGFYSTLGVAVLGTVMDGDCGIDVACQMLSLPQTPAQRAGLREETAELLHFGNYLGFVLKGRAKS